MRILVSTFSRAVVGGVETHLRELLPRLRARGHEVALLHELAGEPGRPRLDGLAPELPRWSVEELGQAEALAQVARWGPEGVFQHGLLDVRLERALVERWPAILYAHSYYGACVSGAKRFAFPEVRMCGRALGPGCLARFLPRRCGGLSPVSMWAGYRLQSGRRALFELYRAVAVASRHMRAEYVRQGLPEAKVRLVPLFSAALAPDPSPPGPRPLTGRVLLSGRLTDVKGGHHLVEALARARAVLGRPLSLRVAGDGPERGRLEVLARARGVPVEFLGWLGPEALVAQMREVDLLAMPSLWPEPFGLGGIEAGGVGLPAVGYATGGIPDWLEPGVSGESAPGERPEVGALADALVRALADPAHHHRLRRGAWEVSRRFTAEAHLDALERLASWIQSPEARAP